MRKPRKPPKVAYRLLTRDDHEDLYARLDRLVAANHDEVRFAHIALAWCTSWRRDVDGHLVLGRCKRATALDRELHAWDFVILLNEAFWTDESVDDAQREALLDHELCHCGVKYGDDGEPVEDERGRVVYRVRKHDLEEFSEIASRHGTWKKNIEDFWRALQRGRQQRLPLDQAPPADDARAVH